MITGSSVSRVAASIGKAAFFAPEMEISPCNGIYECYAIPDELNADCPTDETPQASVECDVPECNPCNVDDQYLTSSGEAKVGYCVCQPANSEGTRTWSCASGTAWPCPLGQGC